MAIANKPAFPRNGHAGAATIDESGMTYRQWLVGMALQGLTAHHGSGGQPDVQSAAGLAVLWADAVLRELDRAPAPGPNDAMGPAVAANAPSFNFYAQAEP
jgi:hypothetical protein